MKTKRFFADCKTRYLALLTVLTLLFTIGIGNAWGAPDVKTDVMFAKGFAGYTTNSFSGAGTDRTAVANSTNATGVTYAMQVFNGSTGAVRGNQSGASSNYSCRNTTTKSGYYISQVSLTVSGGTLDGSTSGRSVVYFGSSAYAKPSTAPSGTPTAASPATSGQTTLTWTNTDEDVSYFILYHLKTASTALSANATTSLKVVWTEKTPEPSTTYTLYLPKGDGTYDNTTTTTDASDLGDADIPFSKKNCGSETLNGTFYYYWVTSPISQGNAVGSMPSTKYNAANPPSSNANLYPIFWDNDASGFDTDPRCVEACAKSVTINKGTSTNCTFTLSKSGAQESCDGVTTTVSITPTTGYGTPVVTQSGASAAPTISGSGNTWTVTYAANTTGTSTINVSCSANNYTITLNKDLTPTTAGTASITATYNSNSNLTSAITKPTMTGWTFAGYFTAKNGGGTQIIGADGNVIASVSGYTDASKNWKYAGNITLYAKWTCTVTWSVNGLTNVYPTQTVTYNSSGSKVASVPTPDPGDYCGAIFAGWSAKNAGSESKTTSYYDDLFKTVGDSPDIKSIGDITFYAVFADEVIIP